MTPQLKIGRNVPPSKISPGNRTPPCIFYRTSQVPARGFCAQPGRGEYLKPQASPSQDFMPSSGRRNFLKLTASQFLGVSPKPPARIFFDPRRSRRWGRLGPRPQTPAGPGYFLTLAGPGVGGGSGRAPKPLPALPFLNARKGSKRSFKGTPAPLKIPRWGALWPCPQTPRPGSSVVTTGILRANRRAPLLENAAYYRAFPESYNCPAGCFALFGREMYGNIRV